MGLPASLEWSLDASGKEAALVGEGGGKWSYPRGGGGGLLPGKRGWVEIKDLGLAARSCTPFHPNPQE